jgi:hypothetical protein
VADIGTVPRCASVTIDATHDAHSIPA